MKNTDIIPLGEGVGAQAITHLSSSTQRQTGRQVERVVARTIVAEVHEQGRAHLTESALQNLGALSALEAHLIQVAPLGESRYKHIVDAYALGAAQSIARW